MLKAIGIALLSWSALTLLWTANLSDGLSELIQFTIVALAFVLGARLSGLDRIFKGLALGILVSSLLVMSQSLQGYFPHPIVSIAQEGLFGNRNMLAEAATLTLIGCFTYQAWWYIPGLLPAILIHPVERASIVALGAAAVTSIWSYSKRASLVISAIVIAAVALFSESRISPLGERYHLWMDTLSGQTIFGHGLGSFYTIFPYLTETWDTVLVRPEHAHNDIIELAFETGLIGVGLYGFMVALAIKYAGTFRPILVAFVVLGMFGFPWHIATTAFIGAVVLGRIAGRGDGLCSLDHDRGLALRARLEG